MLVSLPVVTGRRHRRALRVFACRIDTLTLTRLMVAFIHELHVSCITPASSFLLEFPSHLEEVSSLLRFRDSPELPLLGYLA